METKETRKANIFQRILEDKKAIRECIANHGNLKKLADERQIQFAAPKTEERQLRPEMVTLISTNMRIVT